MNLAAALHVLDAAEIDAAPEWQDEEIQMLRQSYEEPKMNQNYEEASFSHFRRESIIATPSGTVTGIGRGGATIAFKAQEGKLYAAVAYCNPRDNFCRKAGRIKAEGRLNGLLARPELKDDNKYFVSNDDDYRGFVDNLRHFMVADLGYTHRGPEAA